MAAVARAAALAAERDLIVDGASKENQGEADQKPGDHRTGFMAILAANPPSHSA
ncbi:MAG: hypothetical protein UZ16_OP3001003199, partial [Candidatus Hinthialibacteria bacterium OLB16]